jgi:hypothetical protein
MKKTKKSFGLFLCAIGIHKRDALIENKHIIGYGCPRCEYASRVTYWKNNIPPPPWPGQKAEEYAEDVKKYNARHKDRCELERAAVRSVLG